jgi:superfamily II DNA/RNA helicase
VLQNPAVLKLEESHLPEDTFLAQHIVKCEEADKYLIFYALLAFKLVAGKILVFVNSIDECYRLKVCGVENQYYLLYTLISVCGQSDRAAELMSAQPIVQGPKFLTTLHSLGLPRLGLVA